MLQNPGRLKGHSPVWNHISVDSHTKTSCCIGLGLSSVHRLTGWTFQILCTPATTVWPSAVTLKYHTIACILLWESSSASISGSLPLFSLPWSRLMLSLFQMNYCEVLAFAESRSAPVCANQTVSSHSLSCIWCSFITDPFRFSRLQLRIQHFCIPTA